MNDRPILFSGPMVRATLEGRKTQTRRVLKLRGYPGAFDFGPSDTPGYDWTFRRKDHIWEDFEHDRFMSLLPYAPGDRLWVREHWRTVAAYQDLAPSEMGGEEPIRFEADVAWETRGWCCDGPGGRHRQGMHMPRWASRLTLTVTDVRVQRVQEISEDDAKSEGVHWWDWPGYQSCDCDDDDCVWCSHYPSLYTPAFRHLWDGLNANRGFGWEANPWVAAVTFEPHRCNIDQMEEQG